LSQSKKIAQIKWACRRGMLELDFILNQFIDHGLSQLTETEMTAFELFLTNEDPDLYSWLMGYRKPDTDEDKAMVKLIRDATPGE